jgi:ParB/RepB/Spo0J family partition protein
MKIFDKVETVKTDDIFPYHNNPKTHPPEQIDKLCSSIKNYGFTVPLVIDNDNEIITGHGRYKAAQKLGMKELPVIKRDDLTDAEAKALRIADNKVAESEWDMEMLEVEFEAIEDEFTGFDEIEIEGITEEIDIDSFFEEAEENDKNKDNKNKSVKCPNCGEVIEI